MFPFLRSDFCILLLLHYYSLDWWFLFSFLPDITTFEHGIETAFVENPCRCIFLTKSVYNVFFVTCKFQISLRSPKR